MSQKIAVHEGTIRVSPVTAVPQMLRERGIDPSEITTHIGLDLSLFDDPDNMIPFIALGRLVKWCTTRTGCPHFGLLIGQQGGASTLGLIGLLAQYSANVGSALRSLILHLHIHDRGAVPTLSVEQGVAVLGYAIYQKRVEGSDQVYDGAIAIVFNIMRMLCGAAWLPTEVLFSRRRPGDIEPYRSFFQAPLRFDMEQTALVFPAQWLDRPAPDADPGLRQQIEQRIVALEKLNSPDLASELRRVLRVMLITHRGSLEQVAELLSVHRRTLNRRLEELGCTFRGLVNEVRYDIARQLLENTDMPIAEIAATLDYSAPSAFTRAFGQWSGMSPAAWRERRGRDAAI